MAFVVAQNHLSVNMADDDTMEVSSDAGRFEDFDIEIDGVGTPAPHPDDPMDAEDQPDPDDDMRDDVGSPQHDQIPEAAMDDLIDDGDEVLEDADYDIDGHAQQPELSLDEDLIDDGGGGGGVDEDMPHGDAPHDGANVGAGGAEGPFTDAAAAAVTQAEPHAHIGLEAVNGASPSSEAHLQLGRTDSQMQGHDGAAPADEPTILDWEEAEPSEVLPQVDGPQREGEAEATEHAVDETAEAPAAITADLHPCLVTWNEAEMSLFQDQAFSQFLVQDVSLAHKPLSHLFVQCREVLRDSVDDNVELVFDIPQLELRIREDIVNSVTCSLADILDIYVNLSLNDGVDNAEPLRVSLFSKTKFEARIDELREAATSGHGLSRIADLYSPVEEDDETTQQQQEQQQPDGQGEVTEVAQPDTTVDAGESEVGGVAEGEQPEEQEGKDNEEGHDVDGQPAVDDGVKPDDAEAAADAAVQEIVGEVTTTEQLEKAKKSPSEAQHQPEVAQQPDEEHEVGDGETAEDHEPQPVGHDEGEGEAGLELDNAGSSGTSTALGDLDKPPFEDDDGEYEADDFDGEHQVRGDEQAAAASGAHDLASDAVVDPEHGGEQQEHLTLDNVWPQEADGEDLDEQAYDEIDYSYEDEEGGAAEAAGAEHYGDEALEHEHEHVDEERQDDDEIDGPTPDDTFDAGNEESLLDADGPHVDSTEVTTQDDAAQPDVHAGENEESGAGDAASTPAVQTADPVAPSTDRPPTTPAASSPPSSQHAQPDPLTRKRSFAELDELDEITDDIDVKKARPDEA